MQKSIVFALHGFLGNGSDWNPLKNQLAQLDWITPSLFKPNNFQLQSFDQVIQSLLDQYQDQISKYKNRIFMGYSLGGRIGLHFLKNNPNLFDQFIFISTHPGLTHQEEKKQRKENDLIWADKIQNLDWQQFLTEWNQQPVFNNDVIEPKRNQAEYSIESLSAAFTNLSLSQQEDFQELIQLYQNKITWIVGSQDSKFLNLAEDMKQKKILLDYKRIFSGHRILFENPIELAKLLAQVFALTE